MRKGFVPETDDSNDDEKQENANNSNEKRQVILKRRSLDDHNWLNFSAAVCQIVASYNDSSRVVNAVDFVRVSDLRPVLVEPLRKHADMATLAAPGIVRQGHLDDVRAGDG